MPITHVQHNTDSQISLRCRAHQRTTKMRLAIELAMPCIEAYVHTQRIALQPGPIDIYDLINWAMMVVFLGDAHAHTHWDRMRAKWNRRLPEHLLLNMTAFM